jgi:hypothetical protein
LVCLNNKPHTAWARYDVVLSDGVAGLQRRLRAEGLLGGLPATTTTSALASAHASAHASVHARAREHENESEYEKEDEHEMQPAVVFAGEVECWPDAALCHLLAASSQPRPAGIRGETGGERAGSLSPFLNAGIFAGEAGDLLGMLETIAEE